MELLVSKGKILLTSLFHSTVLISLFPYLALIVVIGEKQLSWKVTHVRVRVVCPGTGFELIKKWKIILFQQRVYPKLLINLLVGAGSKGSLSRQQIQASRGGCEKRRISEVLAHLRAFCNLTWREKNKTALTQFRFLCHLGDDVKFTHSFLY